MKVVFLVDFPRHKTPHKPPIKAGTISDFERSHAEDYINLKIVAAYNGELPTGQNLYEVEAKEAEEHLRLTELGKQKKAEAKKVVIEKAKGEKLIGK